MLLKFIWLFFSTKYRLNRQGYWCVFGCLIAVNCGLLLAFVNAKSLEPVIVPVVVVPSFFLIWSYLGQTVKRLHDIGKSGWLIVPLAAAGFIPVCGFWLSWTILLGLGIIPGVPIANEYGPPYSGLFPSSEQKAIENAE